MKAPYPGQGKPLPGGMGSGVWVVEHLVHLTFMDLQLSQPPPEWTRTHDLSTLRSAPAGSASAGFSAERIAQGLHISLEQLLEANRQGLLHVHVSRVAGRAQPSVGVRFSFSCGQRCFEVVSGFPLKEKPALARDRRK